MSHPTAQNHQPQQQVLGGMSQHMASPEVHQGELVNGYSTPSREGRRSAKNEWHFYAQMFTLIALIAAIVLGGIFLDNAGNRAAIFSFSIWVLGIVTYVVFRVDFRPSSPVPNYQKTPVPAPEHTQEELERSLDSLAGMPHSESVPSHSKPESTGLKLTIAAKQALSQLPPSDVVKEADLIRFLDASFEMNKGEEVSVSKLEKLLSEAGYKSSRRQISPALKSPLLSKVGGANSSGSFQYFTERIPVNTACTGLSVDKNGVMHHHSEAGKLPINNGKTYSAIFEIVGDKVLSHEEMKLKIAEVG